MMVLNDIFKRTVLMVERIFRRKKWIRKKHFDLASMLNELNRWKDLPDTDKKRIKREQLIVEATRVLRNYSCKAYRRLIGLRKKSRSRVAGQLKDFMSNIYKFIYGELLKTNREYTMNEKIEELYASVREKYLIFRLKK
jgi:hypothetical protein